MENKQATNQSETESRAANKKLRIAVALTALAATAIAVALFMRNPSSQAGRPVPAPSFEKDSPPPGLSSSDTSVRPAETVITLSEEKLESAQIKTEPAIAQPTASIRGAGGLRTTGVVEANSYKEVPVMPITGGIVREVTVKLGDRVKQGQLLATIFSTELADAQSEYLRMQAEVEEHHRHHKRAEELVEIGAASREELEQATSAYRAAQAKLSSASQRLLLFGMTPQQVTALNASSAVSSLISINAPSSGTIVSRTVNSGEVIQMGKELFRVADLTTVWVIGQVYESDFASARIGAAAAITSQAYPGVTFSGRVSYIDPRVEPQTRTAQLRIEVVNRGQMLKFGMFVDVNLDGANQAGAPSGPAVIVPRAAIQNIGAKQVVFVATATPGVFRQREVTAGAEQNGFLPIYSGVSAGEMVVTEGSFLLRAESLKLNPQQPLAQQSSAASSPSIPKSESDAPQGEPASQSAKIVLTEKGFQPATIRFKRGILARITFVRQVEVTCATEIIISEFNIKRELPFNEAVTVEFTPDKAGEFKFACPMNMLTGKIIVK